MIESDLFENIDDSEILRILQCIGIKTKVFKKNDLILKTGKSINYLGIILSGKAEICKIDYLGNYNIIEKLRTDNIFGQNMVCCGLNKSPVDIVALEECEVLYIPYEKVVTPCEKLCKAHLQIIRNIMKIISKQNNILNEKIDIIGQKNIRCKILALLNNYKKEGEVFTVPYTREEMAKFLCTDRSAMSRELCKMRDEGILRFYKNSFELLK